MFRIQTSVRDEIHAFNLEKNGYTNLMSDVNTLVSTAQGAAYVSDPDFSSGRVTRV